MKKSTKSKKVTNKDLKNLKAVSVQKIEKESKINLRKKVVKKGKRVKTENLSRVKKVDVSGLNLKEGENLLKQFNKYRNAYIYMLKNEEYKDYVEKTKDALGIPLPKKDWWKLAKKDFIIPKTALEVYKEGIYVYDNSDIDEYGNPRKQKVTGIKALRLQVIKLAKSSNKEYRKNQFLTTFEYYGRQSFTTKKSRQKFKEVMDLLYSLDGDEISKLIKDGVLFISYLYSPNDEDDQAEQLLKNIKANI